MIKKTFAIRQINKLFPEIQTIQSLILKEISLGIHKLNGENNLKYINPVSSPYINYESGIYIYIYIYI